MYIKSLSTKATSLVKCLQVSFISDFIEMLSQSRCHHRGNGEALKYL